MGRPLLVLGALGLALATPDAARQVPQAAQAPSQPVFRAGVDYVRLEAVVTDKNDRAVRDLTKDDFEITEHGEPQPIEDFQFVSIPPAHRSVADVAASAPTVDVVTNTHAPVARQWVLVIDDLHIIELHILQTKKIIQDFLEALPAGDEVAIVFVGRSDLSQDFTSDLNAQMRTVNRIRAALGFAPDAANSFGADMPPDANSRERRRDALATMDVLKNVCASLVRSSYSRKALVYVSEGLAYDLGDTFSAGYTDTSLAPFDARDVIAALTETFESARRAGVPVYTIDPRGIPDCTSIRGPCTEPPWVNIRKQWDTMRSLAENTGGLAFVNRPNLTQAVEELVDDNSSFYLLGYYPTPPVRDGKFHSVKVTLKRPGLRVRARDGYTASKAAATTAAAAKQTLEDVLGAALPTDGLSLRAFAAPIAAVRRGMTTAVTVEVSYPPPLAAKLDDTLQFGVVAVDHDGKVKGATRRAFHFTASPKSGAGMTYAIDETIDLPAQPLTLRIGVASQALDRAGTIYLPVEAIDPSRGQLQLSAVAIGVAGPAREAVAPPGRFDGLLPFQPTTARTFAVTDTLRVFARAFWGSKDAEAEATLTVTGASPIARRNITLQAHTSATDHREAALDTTLPVAGLVAGEYRLEVAVHLTNGQTARREVAFEIR